MEQKQEQEEVQTNSKKRVAEKQQRREDLENEEDEEESVQGTWNKASEEVLANRKIVKVRRSKEKGNDRSTEQPKEEAKPFKLSLPTFTFGAASGSDNKATEKPTFSFSFGTPPSASFSSSFSSFSSNPEKKQETTTKEKTEVGEFVVLSKEGTTSTPTPTPTPIPTTNNSTNNPPPPPTTSSSPSKGSGNNQQQGGPSSSSSSSSPSPLPGSSSSSSSSSTPIFSSVNSTSLFTFDPKFNFSSAPIVAPQNPAPSLLFTNSLQSGFSGGSLFGKPAPGLSSSTSQENDEEGGGEGDEGGEEKVDEKPTLAENSTTGEEDEDNLVQIKAKLYLWDKDNAKWRERGVGICRLNHAKDKSYTRLIFREEKVRRILLNFRLFPQFSAKQGKGSLSFVAPDVTSTPPVLATYLLKITEKPSEGPLTNLLSKIDEYKAKAEKK